MARVMSNGRPDPNTHVVDLSACDVPDPVSTAKGEAIRSKVRANRAAARAEVDNRVAYGPGTGDRALIRRSQRDR